MNLRPNAHTLSCASFSASSSSSSSSGSGSSSNNQPSYGTFTHTPHVPSTPSSSGLNPHRHRHAKPISRDLRWIPIPITRPSRYAVQAQDKIGLTNLLSPRPSLNSKRTYSDQSLRKEKEKKGIGDHTPFRRNTSRSTKIWIKAKELTRKTSFRCSPSTSTKKQTLGHDGANDRNRREGEGEGMISEDEEEWEIITPPLVSDEFIVRSSTSQTDPDATNHDIEEVEGEEEMMFGARGTGTITRVSVRAQQGSAYDLSDFNLEMMSVSMNRERSSGSGYTRSGSGSGSGSSERSLEAYLQDNNFPIPPSNTLNTLDDHGDTNTSTSPGSSLSSNSISSSGQRQILKQRSRERPNIPHKRSWLYGGPLTLPEDLEEVERKLPDDHPFNTSSPSQPSQKTNNGDHQSHSPHPKFLIPSYCPPNPERDDHNVKRQYSHLTNLVLSLNLLKEILYQHNSDSMILIYSSEDILPPSIISNIEGRLDRYWNKWANILNLAGGRVSNTINSLDVTPGGGSPQTRSDTGIENRIPKHYSTSIIPPPITNDELEKLIWSLEENGRVASGTYRRMFGGPYLSSGGSPNDGRIEIRKMTELEENQADQLGLRDWMIGEEERLERFKWRRKGE